MPSAFRPRFAVLLLALLQLPVAPLQAASESFGPLVNASYLAAHADDLIVLDLRPTAAYVEGHVPGALNADFFAMGWSQTLHNVPNMAPEPDQLASVAGQFGIEPESRVVIVAASSTVTDIAIAARLMWLLTYLGHDRLAILDGGMQAWLDNGGKLQTTPAEADETFPYPLDNLRPHLLVRLADINSTTHLIDARPAAYHQGWLKHRKAQIAGSLPHSAHLEHSVFIDTATMRFVSPAEAHRQLAALQTTSQDAKVVYCNSGIWASTIWFALYFLAGEKHSALYDGSMVEWTQDATRPVAHTKNRFEHLWREFKELVGLDTLDINT